MRMVTTGALLTGLLLLTSGLLLVQTHAQETKATEKVPVTLESLNKRLTALETENKALKERIAVLEKGNTAQVTIWQPESADATVPNQTFRLDNNVLQPNLSQPLILVNPSFRYQAPGARLQTQPFVWDTQGNYNLLIQQKQ